MAGAKSSSQGSTQEAPTAVRGEKTTTLGKFNSTTLKGNPSKKLVFYGQAVHKALWSSATSLIDIWDDSCLAIVNHLV